jgi:nucleoside-diphosphate-sugar epimerase
MSATVAGRRVAVLGGTGFIGSHLVERLVAEGAQVLAVARTPARIEHLAAVRGGCAIAFADICNSGEVLHTLKTFRPEVLYHLAAHPDASESFAHVADCVRINGLGLVNALQAAAACGVELFVYGDSAKDYGNAPVPYRAGQHATPVCSYAIVKAAGWQLCTLAASFTSLNVVALRPTFVYGARQNRNVITYVQECAAARRPIRLMGGSQTRDPLFIDDAVSAFVQAATEPRAWGHAIPIGGGQELPVSSLCEAVLAAIGARLPIVSGAEEPRLTEIWRSSSDNVDAWRLLGWEPRVMLSEGLERTVAGWAAGASAAVQPRIAVAPPLTGCRATPLASGLVFNVLDRRNGRPDRRSLPRGGRRASDAVPLQHAATPTHWETRVGGAGVPLELVAGKWRQAL